MQSAHDDRSRLERARDEMPADVYDALVQHALSLCAGAELPEPVPA